VAQTTFTDAANTTWVGGSSGHETDWNTAANWSAGVPVSSDTVVIPIGKSFYPIIVNGQSSTIHALQVDSGGTLTINSGGSLTASGVNPTIDGTVNTAGTLDFGPKDLSSTAGTVNITGGTVSVHNFKDNLTMSGGLLQVAGTITTSTTNSFTGGTVDYTGGNAAVTALTYFNLEISSPLKYG
jgi:hypothetical protein